MIQREKSGKQNAFEAGRTDAKHKITKTVYTEQFSTVAEIEMCANRTDRNKRRRKKEQKQWPEEKRGRKYRSERKIEG